MKVNNIVFHTVTGESDNSFVGMKIKQNTIHFYYPESYHFNTENYDRSDFLDLLKTIKIAKKSSLDNVDSRRITRKFCIGDCALMSYIWIIEDYLKHGFYSVFGNILKINRSGKIDWKRTLQTQPLISGRNVIYPNLIVEVKSPQESILVEAHKYCVKKSITIMGWLYGVAPEVIHMSANNTDKMVPEYLEAIRYEMEHTFDDEIYSRLIHMENVLIGMGESVVNQEVVYGVDSYYYVFERMIDHLFGTESIDDYYPTFGWNLQYAEKKKLKGATIRPDTIMKLGSDIFIIDSKFYRYGSLNLSQVKGLPESSSIIKQITYGSYVKSKYPDCEVYNIFVLPYSAKSRNGSIIKENNKDKSKLFCDEILVYAGDVNSDWNDAMNKSYGKIYTFLIDLRYVVESWNRLDHDQIRKNLANMVLALKKLSSEK